MSSHTISLTEPLQEYVGQTMVAEPDVLRRLREETGALEMARMQISPEQGQFMKLLVQIARVRNAIEVGVFTGYSTLCVASALPADGRLIACDVSDEWTAIGRRYWREAGVAERIDLRLAPATETLDALLAEQRQGQFDFAFIDADKANYDGYYERCLQLLRVGGIIAIDNALWSGLVVDSGADDADTLAIRALNLKVRDDQRVQHSLVPIGDGLLLAVKQ